MSGAQEEGDVCLITGVGPGTGTSLVRRFTEAGYRVAMLARSKDRLAELADTVDRAYAFPCDVADTASLINVVGDIRRTLGAPRMVIHNAVGGAFGNFMEIEPEVLERNFQINTMALLHLARLTVQDMIDTGGGVILGTGNTSAYRGKSNFAGFAPSKAAQRILLESIARQVGPMGVHAAYVAIDAVIDVPWTRKMAPEKPDDFFAKPDEIAEECFRIAHQSRSTWSSDVIIRPFGEDW
ncbi:SDR family NAD(P)-dependent oxidoreductase [Roseovarius sp. 2305UL8-3]|uniref:SDR family NAD(P)-dependent oxidoreductase n=1 Tax=Roseovarius conchicola TaxID=3121636 RepID=UPI0035286BE3